MKEPKKPSHVLGNILKCPKYIQCPLCYGCRAYKESDLDCLKCTKNKKRDICNVSLHTDTIINSFITKTNIEIEEDVQFKSYNKEEE